MKLIGLVRLGRDAELRYTNEGKPVLNFSGAWNYGRREGDGTRPSQWCEFAMFGDRAERLAEMLTRGTQLLVVAHDVRVETFERRDGAGQGVKLCAIVADVEFTARPKEGEGQAAPAPAPRAPAPAPRAANSGRQPPAKPSPSGGGTFDDMDDDIPFASPHLEHDSMGGHRKLRRARSAR